MKSLKEFLIFEASQHEVDRWLDAVNHNIESFKINEYPKFPCQIYISEEDSPMGGTGVIKKGLKSLGFDEPKQKYIKSGYFKNKFLVVTCNNEEEYKFLLTNLNLHKNGWYTNQYLGYFCDDESIDKLIKDTLELNS